MAKNLVPRRAVRLVARFEGYYPEVYADPVGYATIGYGHLIAYRAPTNADRKKWGHLSKRQAKKLLKHDLRAYARAVNRLVKVPLNNRQRSALISFTYNVGIGAFEGSTLLRKLNKGKYSTVPHQLARWNKAGGVVLAGLTRRRAAEGRMFRPLHKPRRK